MEAPLRFDSAPDRERVRRAREAQTAWRDVPVRKRLAVVRRFRRSLVDRADELIRAIGRLDVRSAGETLVTELLPMADACRFLERRGASILAPRRPARGDRPLWLAGLRSEVVREPWGLVLVVGPSNYPLLLPGIQTIQALVAGNAVVWKPGRDGEAVARLCLEMLSEAGAPEGLLVALDAPVEAVDRALATGVDFVVLTGSEATGRSVLGRLARDLVPSVMELSGSDPAIVRADADPELTARALAFGVTLNGGDTCIAPRRVLVDRRLAAGLERRLAERLRAARPVPVRPEVVARVARCVEQARSVGARVVTGAVPSGPAMAPLLLADVPRTAEVLRTDLGAPVISIVPVEGDDEAVEAAADGPFRLGATIFGDPVAARRLARRVDAGVVVVNDMIAPTADPRVPFGGRGSSGFGVTRGAEGLLAMTRPKTLLSRTGRFRPHFDPVGAGESALLYALLEATHARGPGRRLRGWIDLISTMMRVGGKKR